MDREQSRTAGTLSEIEFLGLENYMSLSSKLYSEYIKDNTILENFIGIILSAFIFSLVFILAYSFLIGYYFPGELLSLNFIIYPIPFDSRSIMFIGTIIVLVTIFYVKCTSSVEKIESGEIRGLTSTLVFMSLMTIGLISLVTYFITGKIVLSLIANIGGVLFTFFMTIIYFFLKEEIASLNMMIYLFFTGFLIFIVDLYLKIEFGNSTIISIAFMSFVFSVWLLLDLYTNLGIFKYKMLVFLMFLIGIFISFSKIEYLRTININLFFLSNIILAIISSILIHKFYIKFCKIKADKLIKKIQKYKIFQFEEPDSNKTDMFLERHNIQLYIILFSTFMVITIGGIYSIGRDLSLYVDESKVSQKIMIDDELIYEGTLIGISEGLMYISTDGKLVIIDANGLVIKN